MSDLQNQEKPAEKSKIAKDFEEKIQAKKKQSTIKKYMEEKNIFKKQKLARKLRFKYKLDPAKVAAAYQKHNFEPQDGMWCDSQAACGIGIMLYDYFMCNGLDCSMECDECGAEEDEECDEECDSSLAKRNTLATKEAGPDEIAEAIENQPETLATEKLGLKPNFINGFTSAFDDPNLERFEKLKKKAKPSESDKGYMNGVAVRLSLADKGMLDLPESQERLRSPKEIINGD